MVGRGQYNGGPVDYVNGTVDDVQVWNRALSAADVAELYQAAGGFSAGVSGRPRR